MKCKYCDVDLEKTCNKIYKKNEFCQLHSKNIACYKVCVEKCCENHCYNDSCKRHFPHKKKEIKELYKNNKISKFNLFADNIHKKRIIDKMSEKLKKSIKETENEEINYLKNKVRELNEMVDSLKKKEIYNLNLIQELKEPKKIKKIEIKN